MPNANATKGELQPLSWTERMIPGCLAAEIRARACLT